MHLVTTKDFDQEYPLLHLLVSTKTADSAIIGRGVGETTSIPDMYIINDVDIAKGKIESGPPKQI